jgi:dTDP-glucose pyrophosphorylase
MHLLPEKVVVQVFTMNKIPMIIMAAGVSSRMKDSSVPKEISQNLINQSNHRVKGFIQAGEGNEPIIFYIIKNCISAGVKNFYIILSDNSDEFQDYLKKLEIKLSIQIKFGFQDFYGKLKPMGTADAIFQIMNQFKELRNKRFLVCNSDNLYSSRAIKLLLAENNYNSMIAYDFDCLKFSTERLESLSILKIKGKFLDRIIEKPDMKIIKNYSKKFVSMNIFSLKGKLVYQYLKDCPITIERGEKEIASALQNMILDNKKSMIVFHLCEHVPDLTFKEDIDKISKFLN